MQDRRKDMRTTLLVGLLVFGGPAVLGAAPPTDTGRVAAQLRAALTPLPHSQTSFGACVIDLTDGRTVFEAHADTRFVPASTMKVFAMLAALAELGPGFAFETVLAFDGTHLYVIGDGDPGFGDERLHAARDETIYAPFDRWADALLARGWTVVPGNLVVDESIFEPQLLHPGWEAEDLGKWYAAPVGGLNINDNCVDITVTPGAHVGDLVGVTVRPQADVVHVMNECRTGNGKPVLHHAFGSRDYRIAGRCSKRWPFGPVAFPDPGLLFADALRLRLAGKGVRIDGRIIRERVRLADGTLPGGLTVIDRHRTPLADCLDRAGKDSQNLFAECLLKRAGYAMARRQSRSEAGKARRQARVGTDRPGRDGVADPQGSWELGGSAVLRMVYDAGIALPGLRVADGSGLSRRNSCTPRQLASILRWAQDQPFAESFYPRLAEAGVDGSLRRRLRNLEARVFAKTGTMRGVRTLAGYVGTESGPRFAFAVMFNGYPGPSTPYKEIQDRFCRVLAEAFD